MPAARTVIFDGECGFCRRWIRLGKKLDWFKKIDWRARLDPGTALEFPQVSKAESLNRIVSIRPDGKTYGGFRAMRDIMLRLPASFLLALLMYLPGVAWVGEPAYQWVSKNRHRFGGSQGKSCGVKD